MRRFRWWKRLLAVTLILALLAVSVIWLCFQHIPSWYQPLWLSQAEVDAVRDRSEQTFEIVSQKMVAGDPFSITFTAQPLNEIFSAQRSLWPAATDWLNPQFHTPCVDIKPEHIKLGLRYHSGEIQSIISVQVTPQIRDDELTVHLAAVRAGSLPIPSKLLNSLIVAFQSVDNHPSDEVNASTNTARLRQFIRRMLMEGESASTANYFNWPNGDIPFQITAISLDSGSITMEIQPDVH